MKKLIVSVALSPDSVSQLDSNRGKGIKISRSSLVEDAVRAYLLYLEGSEAPHNQKTLIASRLQRFRLNFSISTLTLLDLSTDTQSQELTFHSPTNSESYTHRFHTLTKSESYTHCAIL